MVKRKDDFDSLTQRRKQRIKARSLKPDQAKPAAEQAISKIAKPQTANETNRPDSKRIKPKKTSNKKPTPKLSIKNPIKESHQKRQTLKRRLVIILSTLAVLGLIAAAVKVFWLDKQTVNNNTSSETSTISNNTDAVSESASVNKQSKADQQLDSVRSTLSGSSYGKNSVLQLNVPVYQQTYNQSCEASALRMALAYRGVTTTDEAILTQIGYDGEPAKMVDGQRVWTNPHKQFVGYRDGDQTQFTGYGVFAEPIASAAEQNGRTAVVQNDVQLDWIVQQLYSGNPVILWGVSIKISDGQWQTTSGESITVPMRTHTRLVIGVKGDFNNPDGFYVNDPATGRMVYWTAENLKADIAKGIKQAVAIY